jgi:DNA-binding transcriptional ArsR family regulator
MPAANDISAEAAELLKLLADPTRRQIFLAIMGGEICNCELAKGLGLPQNLVSHHVRRLRAAGLVEEHPDPHDGRWSHFTVNPDALAVAWEGLQALHPSRIGDRAPACRVRAKKGQSLAQGEGREGTG